MKYRRRSAPVSTLRARLQQRLAEKNSWEGRDDYFPDDGEREPRPFFPAAIIRAMHRYLLVKITAAVVVVFVAAFLIQAGRGWGEPVLQALRFVVEWDIKPDVFSGKAIPAFNLLRENMELPPGWGEGPPLPFAGALESGYGLRDDAAAGREQMHYGVDLSAPGGTAVRALYAGSVESAVPGQGEGNPGVVVINAGSGWAMIYRGLDAVEVKAGDAVEPGMLLGKLGPPRRYDLPHLHFELRCGGRPAPPPQAWLARFEPTGTVTEAKEMSR